jgi:hypothetical protein
MLELFKEVLAFGKGCVLFLVLLTDYVHQARCFGKLSRLVNRGNLRGEGAGAAQDRAPIRAQES